MGEMILNEYWKIFTLRPTGGNKKLAPRAGLEPATRWLTASCSAN